jgi:hypothetical protein
MMSIHTKLLMVLALVLLVYFLSCSNIGETERRIDNDVDAISLALSDSQTDIAVQAWASVQPRSCPTGIS